MRRADRLFRILQLVRGRRLSTAAWLAEKLEVSERTVYRDVAALQAQGMDLRLYSLWGGGGEFRGLPVRRFNLWKICNGGADHSWNIDIRDCVDTKGRCKVLLQLNSGDNSINSTWIANN